jgi:hypothetical protein
LQASPAAVTGRILSLALRLRHPWDLHADALICFFCGRASRIVLRCRIEIESGDASES